MKSKTSVFLENGEEVIRMSSRSLTAFVPASVPLEVIELWRQRLASHLRRRIGRLRHAERRWKRRRLKPVRLATRMRTVKKRIRKPLRQWKPVLRR
jgi:hypothetical protein